MKKNYTWNFFSFIAGVIDTAEQHTFAIISANFRKKSKRSQWHSQGPGGHWFTKKTWGRKSRVRLPLMAWFEWFFNTVWRNSCQQMKTKCGHSATCYAVLFLNDMTLREAVPLSRIFSKTGIFCRIFSECQQSRRKNQQKLWAWRRARSAPFPCYWVWKRGARSARTRS